jgi:hypothetical protein
MTFETVEVTWACSREDGFGSPLTSDCGRAGLLEGQVKSLLPAVGMAEDNVATSLSDGPDFAHCE